MRAGKRSTKGLIVWKEDQVFHLRSFVLTLSADSVYEVEDTQGRNNEETRGTLTRLSATVYRVRSH